MWPWHLSLSVTGGQLTAERTVVLLGQWWKYQNKHGLNQYIGIGSSNHYLTSKYIGA